MSAKSRPIEPYQKKRIHMLKSKLGMSEELYRDMLHAQAQVNSSNNLDYYQAADIIAHMEKNAAELKIGLSPKTKKYDNLKRSNAYPTPAQLRYIEGLWNEKSRASAEMKAEALDKFIKRICGVDSIKFLKKKQVQPLLNAIKSLKPTEENNVN